MSCPPRSASGFRKFSSCSDVLTSGRNQSGAITVCCPNGPSSGYRGAGCFSSRSLCGVGSCVPRIANCHPVRCGNGYGGAGNGFGYCGPRYGYGDMCYGGYGNGYGFRRAGVCGPCAPGFPSIAINKNLLRPLKLEIDAAAPAAKLQEKEQLKSLNSKLATLIDKVQSLEQQNIVLKIKWGFLKRRKCCENHSKPMLDEYISTLKKQIEALGCERAQLEEEMKDWQEVMASNKSKFEEEYNQRTHAESEFIALKKDVDSAFMRKQELEAKTEAQSESLNLSRTVFEQELNELQSYILDTSVTVQMDNRRSLEMNNIIDEFRARYEEFASRSRAEADVWYQRQCQELRMTATKYNDKLSKLRAEISELIRIIQTLEGEISNAKAWHCKQEEKLAAAEERGETSVKDAQGKLAELEGARLKAKQDMACQLREYQELMNIKLALDIEIATYRKLLEGEEFRLGEGQLPVNISVQRNHGGIVCDTDPCYGEGHFSGCGSGNKPEGICSSTGVVCGANTGRNLSRSCGPPSRYTCETRRSVVASCTPRKDVCASRKDACVP